MGVGPGGVGRVRWGVYGQDTSHTCMRLSKRKQKNSLKELISQFLHVVQLFSLWDWPEAQKVSEHA